MDIPVLAPAEVQGRINWALRRGLKQWLWPDIAPEAWREGVAAIANAAREVLAGQCPSRALDGDPTILSLAAFTSGMGPILGFWIESGQLAASATVAAMLENHLRQNRRRTEQLRAHAVRAVELLAKASIRPVLIKGMHTAFEYFPTPEVRPLSDIDIVVQPTQLRDAERIFREAGYVRELLSYVPYQCNWTVDGTAKLPQTLLCVHADDPWAFDLQTTLNRHLNNGAVAQLDNLRVANTVYSWCLSDAADVLSQPLLTLLLAAHASESRINLTIIRLIELILVVRRDVASGALSWDELLVALRKLGPRFVYPAFAFCEQLVPGTIPKMILDVCEMNSPPLLRRFVSRHDLSKLQGLDHHSLIARYMWVDNCANAFGQMIRELVPPFNRPLSTSYIRSMYLNRMKAMLHITY